MSQQNAAASAVILTNASQWYLWLSIIEASAKQMNIWEYIDPSQELELPHVEPILALPATVPGASAEEKANAQTIAIETHRRAVKLYDIRQQNLIQIQQSIYKSVSAENLHYVMVKSTPYQALRALQTALAPDADDRLLEVDQQYRVLCQGLPRGQNLDKWLNKWEKVYAEMKAIKHSDMESGLILTYFLASIRSLDPGWAQSAKWSIQEKKRTGIPTQTFLELLAMFR